MVQAYQWREEATGAEPGRRLSDWHADRGDGGERSRACGGDVPTPTARCGPSNAPSGSCVRAGHPRSVECTAASKTTSYFERHPGERMGRLEGP